MLLIFEASFANEVAIRMEITIRVGGGDAELAPRSAAASGS
ncbi:MAG TPA: hypothetical protein VFJ47_02020 [Terriglobales bacterium]|nr:hypothetical protein [Terriglobales bacterium]